jgi:hypothetical protein
MYAKRGRHVKIGALLGKHHSFQTSRPNTRRDVFA